MAILPMQGLKILAKHNYTHLTSILLTASYKYNDVTTLRDTWLIEVCLSSLTQNQGYLDIMLFDSEKMAHQTFTAPNLALEHQLDCTRPHKKELDGNGIHRSTSGQQRSM